MKYTCEVTIGLPRDRVVELFDNPDNMSKWMPGLQSFEHLTGEQGQPGATSRLVFDQGGKRVEMIETIVSRTLPDEFSGTYETEGVKNSLVHRFHEDGPEKTRWVSETEFEFSGKMKMMAPMMKGAFKEQTQEYMDRFRMFAESA
jgi:carbon monoxide dehydrogenase subunit G